MMEYKTHYTQIISGVKKAGRLVLEYSVAATFTPINPNGAQRLRAWYKHELKYFLRTLWDGSDEAGIHTGLYWGVIVTLPKQISRDAQYQLIQDVNNLATGYKDYEASRGLLTNVDLGDLHYIYLFTSKIKAEKSECRLNKQLNDKILKAGLVEVGIGTLLL